MAGSGIYAIVCIPTNQRYVGYAVNWEKRTKSHFSKLERGVHKNKKLQDAWFLHGENNFKFELLELCPIKDLVHREYWWIKHFNSVENGFNNLRSGCFSNTSHGMSGTPTFKSWESMLQRCNNPNSPDYPKWGGCGIKVHESWFEFSKFYADMGERPPGTSIDRHPNKFGNYEPGNCRWATGSEQQKNKSNTLFITHNGICKPLVEWADEKGMPRDLLRRRYHAGMLGDELFAPSYSRYKGDVNGVKRKRVETRHNLHKFEYKGKMRSITEIAELAGIKRSRLKQRLVRDKMSLEVALSENALPRGKAGPRNGRVMLTAFGKTQSISRWAEQYHMALSTLRNRIFRSGMKLEDALTLNKSTS